MLNILLIHLMTWFQPVVHQPGQEIIDDHIKTIRLYPAVNDENDQLRPAIVTVDDQRLVLEFDDLRENIENYYVRLIHCDRDWNKSGLHDLDFLKVYNEFTINDYAYSSNTHVPYVHYRFQVPEVSLPGNYILSVYRDGDKGEKAFTRRFSVFRQDVQITPVVRPGQSVLRKDLQQVNFQVRYDDNRIPDPTRTVNVVIRQNQRWDNAVTGLSPYRTDPYKRTLDYVYFDETATFKAGNEFRFFDFTSVNYPGQNTGYLDKKPRPYHLFLATDKSRGSEVYAQYRDLNGNYMTANRDAGHPETTGQYVYVHFLLEAATAGNDPVYVTGTWSDWQLTEPYRMVPDGDLLEAVVLMKQGFYNYAYVTRGDRIEGNHFETENQYEILVYNRNFSNNADVLVGYYVYGRRDGK
ncbi:MAG: type IX secretion system plug protein domain-containing protein [Bacteroidota bacterium]